MTQSPDLTNPTDAVRSFYREMPFNWYSDAENALENLRRNPIAAYPDLDALLEDGAGAVLELGCGAGWAANAMGLHYGCRVTGVDFTRAALDRAREVAQKAGVAERVQFVASDLFNYRPATPPDLVVSIGVLHHTRDCRAGFAHAASCVPPGGALFVGLYHLFGRRPFLSLMRDIVDREGEDAALARFAEMAPTQGLDPVHLQSWFRDQVLHPHETQHTLEEVWDWLDQEGLVLETTNINHYAPPEDRAALIAEEKTLEAHSAQRNGEERRFFPGFFTVLAHRPE